LNGPNNPSVDNLSGKVAIITGGASGIGLGIAEKLSAKGMKVVIADINAPRSTVLNSSFFHTDIANSHDIDLLYKEVEQNDLLPDVLVCCAGIGIMEKLSEGDPDKWQKVIETNLLGNLRFIRAFAHCLESKGKGDVVIISSVSGDSAYAYGGVYCASKAGLNMIAETLRLELQPKVRVTNIAPGVVDTDFFQNSLSGSTNVPEIGWGALKPSDIAEALYFAISRPQGVVVNNIILRPVAQVL
jgi:NADP-dependent 3-hydroxy acid dehydrogenase YdfG